MTRLPRDEADAPSMLRPIDVSAAPDARMVTRGGLALLGVTLQGGVRFLTSFLVGRLTSPATLAVVSGGISLANILSLTWPTSTGSAASRFIARARGEGGNPEAEALLEIGRLQRAEIEQLAGHCYRTADAKLTWEKEFGAVLDRVDSLLAHRKVPRG